MTIRYKCVTCGSTLKIKDELAGTDGKCPKCKTAFHVPEPDAADSDAEIPTDSDSHDDAAPADAEDDIFGKDFFKMEETPTRTRGVPQVFKPDDDDQDEKPVKKPIGKPKEKTPAPTSLPEDSAENAADIASTLLAKTGKKNRAEASEPPPDATPAYDFSEVSYLLKKRVLPIGGGLLVTAIILYWASSSMFGGKSNLPDLARVYGKVTVDGQPAAQAQIQFIPADTAKALSGAPSMAYTSADGTYEAMYKADIRGAVPGKHSVEIIAAGKQFKEEFTVEDKSNEKNFDLKTQ